LASSPPLTTPASTFSVSTAAIDFFHAFDGGGHPSLQRRSHSPAGQSRFTQGRSFSVLLIFHLAHDFTSSDLHFFRLTSTLVIHAHQDADLLCVNVVLIPFTCPTPLMTTAFFLCLSRPLIAQVVSLSALQNGRTSG
jgi:hypothetical protein